MSRRFIIAGVMLCVVAVAAVYAGDGFTMKCGVSALAKDADGKAVKPCGFKQEIVFGGGMFFDQVQGYCRSCKKFVAIAWTREGAPLPPEMAKNPVAKPKPLGEVWDGETGRVLTIYACPHCKGPFSKIDGPANLKYCPSCNQPGFGIDPDSPVMAVD